MKFLKVFLNAFTAFTGVFFAALALGSTVGMFFLWDVPSWAEVQEKGPWVVRATLTGSFVMSWVYMFSKDGQAEWRL